MAREFRYLGSVSHGTMQPRDLIPVFADVLGALDTERNYDGLLCDARAWDEDTDEDDAADDILSELFDALDTFAPAYHYFGAHPGDGADYGYWPTEEMADVLEFIDRLDPDDIRRYDPWG